jgi:site-specific DNA-methyltransferase (adenine-specific)
MAVGLELDTVICGDALEVLREMPDKSVDMVLTDPPYFLPATQYQTRTVFARSLSELGILESFFRQFFEEAARITKSDGVWYVFCDANSYPIFYALAYPRCRKIRVLPWDKGTSINGYTWRHQHELIMFAELPDAKRIPTGDGDVLKERAEPVQNRLHAAQKPVALLERIIKKHDAAVVLDAFCGSGSTLVAAKKLGRHYIGIDISPEYCEMARKRIAEVPPSLFEP